MREKRNFNDNFGDGRRKIETKLRNEMRGKEILTEYEIAQGILRVDRKNLLSKNN